MKRNWNKVFVGILMSVVCVVVMACANNEEVRKTESDSNSFVPTQDYVYSAEYYTIEDSRDYTMYSPLLYEEKLYYEASEINPEIGGLPKNGFESRTIPDMAVQSITASLDANGLQPQICDFTIASDGMMYILWTVYDYEHSENNRYYLSKHSLDGTLEKQINLEEIFGDANVAYVSEIVVDDRGTIYISTADRVYILDKKFKKTQSVLIGQLYNMFLMEGDRVFGTRHSNSYELVELNGEKGAIAATYNKIPAYNGFFAEGGNGKLLYAGPAKLYEFDLDTQQSVEVLTWVDCNIAGDTVRHLQVLEDGRIAVVAENYNTEEKELIFLNKVLRTQVTEKEIITLASFAGDDWQLQQAIVSFNKESDKYKIELKNYYDYGLNFDNEEYEDALTRLHIDIVSGDAPDIINLRELDMYNLADSKALEDLTPYLEKSIIANKDDFEEGILQAFQLDGMQVTVPQYVYIEGFFGKSSLAGEAAGWTIEEMINMAENNPEAAFIEHMSKINILEFSLKYGSESFIDYETGTCSFDSEGFIRLLEFANSFTAYGHHTSDGIGDLRENKLLLWKAVITDMLSYQVLCETFDEAFVCKGYPTGDGAPVVALNGFNMYAVAARSDCKDGAFAFIESVLAVDNRMYHHCIPSRSSILDAMLNEACEVEYQKDADGELILDKEGNPIEKTVGYGSYDGWEFEIGAATVQQVEAIRDLLAAGRADGVKNQPIINIIQEEAAAYFVGQKTAKEVADIIQSRVEIYVSENG